MNPCIHPNVKVKHKVINIAKVGGDPENITISGESAGATNVAHLIASPLAKGLFNKAIHQSAGWSIAEKDINYDIQTELSDKLSIKLIGKTNKLNNLKECLRSKSFRFDRNWESKERYSMDWYYPVLSGAFTESESIEIIKDKF